MFQDLNNSSAVKQTNFNFTFMWPWIVTNSFIIKPTRCTNFTNIFWHETLRFWQLPCPSSGPYSLYTEQWHMSYTFVDSFRGRPGWNSVTSWWWTEELSETCRVSCQNIFVKLHHLVGFIMKVLNNYLLNSTQNVRDILHFYTNPSVAPEFKF